jgi:hypothetical protein
VSWFVAEEADDRFEELDGASCGTARGFAPDAGPADVKGVVQGCAVVVCGTEKMERDRAHVVGSGVRCEVGAAIEDRFGAFHDIPFIVLPSSCVAFGLGSPPRRGRV